MRNNKFYLFCFLLFVLSENLIIAQPNFTMEEAVVKGRSTLAPARLKQLNFTKVNGQLSFIDESKTGEVLTLVDVSGEKTPVIALSLLNEKIKAAANKELKSFPLVEWKDAQSFKFILDKVYWEFDLKTQALSNTKLSKIAEGLTNADISPSGNVVAYTKDENLFVKVNGKEMAVCTDGNAGLVYGQAAHRNEFGIDKGTFFSPKGNYLAFYRMDQSMVTDYPIIDWGVKPAKSTSIKYPFAGDKSHQVTLGIFNLANQKIHYIKTTGDPEQYLTNIAWSPDETKIYIAVINREQSHMQLNEYNAQTGEFIRMLFEEKDEKFIEPMEPMQFVKNNPSQFVWQSNRDGFKHLYLYDINGKVIKQLTKGNWDIKTLNGFDAKGENFFFHCNASSPINQDFCMVNLKTGLVKTLTKGDGYHVCSVNENGTTVIDNLSNPSTPRIQSVIDVKTGKITALFTAPNPVKEYQLGKIRLLKLKAEDGTDLYCRMFYPVGFDSTKKYPVLVYLYNGPHSQQVTNSWLGGADLWYHYMAQHGVIMFTLDGRGTSHRGKAFEQAIHRQVGKMEMKDQMEGVNYLKSLSYVDASRLGIHGWSYGGFMTTSIMTRYPGVFKTGVAGGPVIDWSYYEIMYGERYMDTPQENKEGYDENNLINNIQYLKGDLMIIHGTDDDVVVWQHSLMLLKKAVEKNIYLDYYVYPGHQHNVLGKDRVHLMQKICDYFVDKL